MEVLGTAEKSAGEKQAQGFSLYVARALLRAASRLFSTLAFAGEDSVGTSADAARRSARATYNPAFFHSASTRCFTSGDILSTSGHGLVNPSPGHFRVASIPILLP